MIDVTIYTDPLCCWSWAFEPQLQELKAHFGKLASWHYRMGGLLPSWKNFHDEINSVNRPVQMGPIWMHAGQIANMPIHHQLWMKDPPASSYPACIAVKCAQLQSPLYCEAFLDLLRQACMANGKNIATQFVLFDTAMQLNTQDETFNVQQFKDDFYSDRGIEAFRADLELVKYYNINRFPTLIISYDGKSIITSGYKHYTAILQAIETAFPESKVERQN